MRLIHLSDLHQQLDWRRRSLRSSGWRGAPGRFELHVLRRLARFDGVFERISLLLQRAQALAPTHLLLTGDLTALGDEEEMRTVHDVLAPLLRERRISVIPGNHDRYTDTAGGRVFERIFGRHIQSDLPHYADDAGYPFVHFIEGKLAVVGIDTTRVPGFCHYVVGRVGSDQLRRLDALLGDEQLQQRTVVVLGHHGPLGPAGRFHWRESGLLDAGALLDVLRRHPGVLFHHGHSHQRYWHAASLTRPHIFGGGSSTQKSATGCFVVDVAPARVTAHLLDLAGGLTPLPSP